MPTRLSVFAFVACCVACAGGVEPDRPKSYTRAEFDKAVIGKSAPAIVKSVGSPWKSERGQDGSDVDSPKFSGNIVYTEKEVTVTDPLSNRPSRMVHIYFESGKASEVRY